jgi:hypothetical protein
MRFSIERFLSQWMGESHCARFALGLALASLSNTAAAQCAFDLDNNANARATRDAVAMLRYASGVRATLVTMHSGLTTVADESARRIVQRHRKLDVTGDGAFDPRDALIISRHLLGVTGDALSAGIQLLAYERTAAQIATYLENDCTGSEPTRIDPFTYAGTGVVHYLTPTSGPSGSSYIYRPNIPALRCGDTIAFRAGTYEEIILDDKISGAPNCPVIIRNDGGQVLLNVNGIALAGVKHVILRSQTRGTYGFKVTSSQRAGVSISESSKDLDISGLESVGTLYGIVIKTDPSCAMLNHVYPTLIEDIRVHETRTESTVYEGMYIGYWDPRDITLTCSGSPITVKAQRLSRIKVFNNITLNTGNDGIKLRLCLNGCDIADNSITGYGMAHRNTPNPETAGAFCTGITVGSETWGRIVGNQVAQGYCFGIDVRTNAAGVIEIANNSTSAAGYLPGWTPSTLGPSWAGGIVLDILSPWTQFLVRDNTASGHRGADMVFTDYAVPKLPYVGSECGNSARIPYSIGITNGMSAIPKC